MLHSTDPIQIILGFILAVIVDTGVLRFLKWGLFRNSIQAALSMNLGSTLTLIVLGYLWEGTLNFGAIFVLFALITSIKFSILRLFRNNSPKMNLLVAIVANALTGLILLFLSILSPLPTMGYN